MLYLDLHKEIISRFIARIDLEFADYCTEDWLKDDIVKCVEEYDNVKYLGR